MLLGPVSPSNYLIILLHQRRSLVQYFFFVRISSLWQEHYTVKHVLHGTWAYRKTIFSGKLLQSREFVLQALVWKENCLHRENKITSLRFRYRQVLLYSMQLNFIVSKIILSARQNIYFVPKMCRIWTVWDCMKPVHVSLRDSKILKKCGIQNWVPVNARIHPTFMPAWPCCFPRTININIRTP